MRYELGVIGGGNMAEAIVCGALKHGVLKASNVIVSDPVGARRAVFETQGITTTDDNARVVKGAKQVMLAVKPQMLTEIAAYLKEIDIERQVVVSIMAGVSTRKIVEMAVGGLRVVRVMPNTPLIVGRGMSAISMGEHALEGDKDLILRVLTAAGEAVVLDEEHMDAVGALSGSGPAYVFYLAEAMAEAASSMGMPAKWIDTFVQQTILGAATLMKESEESPSELRRRVTSPGGSTQAAIESMEAANVWGEIVAGVVKARDRNIELGQ